MLNILTGSGGSVKTALALIRGHHTFLKNNTGRTDDPTEQHFVINPEGVLSNNRHFIAATRMEYQPNGDGTTEGQALLILGYCYAYMATKDKEYLDAAVRAWDGYVKYYYAGQPIPNTPRRWICNWLVNSKEPCLANWPINPEEPTQGGYKCVPLRFVNGEAQIPHGSPFWGEYLDVVTFAHRGHMTWAAINGSVQKINNPIDWDLLYDSYRVTTMPAKPYDPLAWVRWNDYLGADNYSVNWGVDEAEIPVLWMNAWTNNRIDVDSGDILHPIEPADVGRIKLAQSLNGVYFVNYAVRLPEEHGGYRFARNQPWHNRPVHTPLLGSVNQMGNASDAEQWFADACLLLATITGDPKYNRAMSACLYTCYEYANIDGNDKFFRKSKTAVTPFTDGISYDFTYPSDTQVVYSRDSEGYIKMVVNQGAQVSLEQQSVWFRVTKDTIISTDFGGQGITGKPVKAEIRMILNPSKSDTAEDPWVLTLPLSHSSVPRARNFSITSLTRGATAVVGNAIMASVGLVSTWGGVTKAAGTGVNIVDGREGPVVDCFIPDDDGGLDIDMRPAAPIDLIVYKSDGDTNLRFVDDNGWRWWWMLEDTSGAWVSKPLLKSQLRLSGYQPNHPGEPSPSAPVYTKIEEFSILLDSSSQTNVSWSYYSLNGMPSGGEGYIPADTRAIASYGPIQYFDSFSSNIVDGRDGPTVEALFGNDDAELIIGNWLQPGGRAPLNAIVYKSDAPTNLRITDDNQWRWYWLLPSTNNQWVRMYLPSGALRLNYYQPYHADTDPRPSAPSYSTIEDFIVVLENSSDTNVSWSYYCLNEMPERFMLDDAYTMKYRVTLSCEEPFTAYLGDCTALRFRDDSLAYCPGVIPFSNIYAEGTDQISSWHGMPYPGYQYPLIYCLNLGSGNYDRHLTNMINFLYDSQQAYARIIGELGPVASAYIWNRWDNFKYGEPDRFTMYHWGDGIAWSGYQPRAFQGACRVWQELVAREQPVPTKLVEYCNNWIRWLADYVKRNGGLTPTDFPPTRPSAPLEDDFTGHMCGLWLAGACMAAMAGSTEPGLDDLIEACVKELGTEYVVTGVPGHPMDGAWSPAVRVSSDNGMYFGFWGGEIMRGLGLYVIYKKHGPVANFYRL